jgi:hypothetical protein
MKFRSEKLTTTRIFNRKANFSHKIWLKSKIFAEKQNSDQKISLAIMFDLKKTKFLTRKSTHNLKFDWKTFFPTRKTRRIMNF